MVRIISHLHNSTRGWNILIQKFARGFRSKITKRSLSYTQKNSSVTDAIPHNGICSLYYSRGGTNTHGNDVNF